MDSNLNKITSEQLLEVPDTLEKVKSGRRRKEETNRYLETPLNPYFKIHEKLIEYLESIGLIHGLCFTPDLRKSLKHHNKIAEIQWDPLGKGWYYQDEV